MSYAPHLLDGHQLLKQKVIKTWSKKHQQKGGSHVSLYSNDSFLPKASSEKLSMVGPHKVLYLKKKPPKSLFHGTKATEQCGGYKVIKPYVVDVGAVEESNSRRVPAVGIEGNRMSLPKKYRKNSISFENPKDEDELRLCGAASDEEEVQKRVRPVGRRLGTPYSTTRRKFPYECEKNDEKEERKGDKMKIRFAGDSVDGNEEDENKRWKEPSKPRRSLVIPTHLIEKIHSKIACDQQRRRYTLPYVNSVTSKPLLMPQETQQQQQQQASAVDERKPSKDSVAGYEPPPPVAAKSSVLRHLRGLTARNLSVAADNSLDASRKRQKSNAIKAMMYLPPVPKQLVATPRHHPHHHHHHHHNNNNQPQVRIYQKFPVVTRTVDQTSHFVPNANPLALSEISKVFIFVYFVGERAHRDFE